MFLDLILILLFIFSVWKGWRKGFVTMILRFAGLVVAIIISYLFRKQITDFAMTLPFAERINDSVVNGAEGALGRLASLPFIAGEAAEKAESLTYLIVQFIAMAAVFLIVSVLMWIVVRLVNGIVRAAGIGGLNRVLGMCLGGINGYIMMYIVAILSFSFGNLWSWLGEQVAASILAQNLPNPLSILYKII